MSRLLAYAAELVDYLPGFLSAAWIALEITIYVIALSWACGLAAALGKRSRWRALRWPCEFYVWFIRGTPTIIQIFIVYFGFPQMGMKMSPFIAGVLALGVNSGAYVAEIVRSGLNAIPQGQYESSTALGLSYLQMMRRIILPQVFRIILPPITNEAITTLKNTSLLSVITVVELTLHAQIVIARTFRPFEFYILAALLYLVMTTLLSRLATWLEAYYERRS